MYNVRDIVSMDIDTLNSTFYNGYKTVVFDDAAIKVKSRCIIVSWYLWEAHRTYPHTPLLTSHHVGSGILSNSKIFSVLGLINESIFAKYVFEDPIAEQELIAKVYYQSINNLYNFITNNLGAYVGSANIVDLQQLFHHPKISESNNKIKAGGNRIFDNEIRQTYSEILDVVENDPCLRTNAMVRAVRQNLVKREQFLQCIGPRGNVTDIDSNIFKNTIKTGFVEGMRCLEDVMKESRSASKALFFQNSPMQKSEYFNRVMQLSGAIVKYITPVDCGTKDTIDFDVIEDNNHSIDYLTGKQHLVDGQFVRINRGDKHLLGQIIKLRSIFNCKHPDPYGICLNCFGDLGRSFPKDTNIGHFCSTEMLSTLSQMVISTKHLDGSSRSNSIVIDKNDTKYIEFGTENYKIKINNDFDISNLKVLIPNDYAHFLNDVNRVNSVNSLTTSRITQICRIIFEWGYKDKATFRIIDTIKEARVPSFTHEALQYIKTVGWQLNDKGMLMIDMSKWDKTLDLLEYPLKHYNTSDFLSMVSHVLKSPTTKKPQDKINIILPKRLIDYSSPEEALADVNRLISSKIYVHLSHLEVILLGCTIESLSTANFNLPFNRRIGNFVDNTKLMTYRSLSAALAYEYQSKTMMLPESHVITNRPDHPLDSLLLY